MVVSRVSSILITILGMINSLTAKHPIPAQAHSWVERRASLRLIPRWIRLDAVASVNPAHNRVNGTADEVETEVWAFGRLPLAFSARCFTARYHHLNKDECAFRCCDDADDCC